MKLFDNIEFSPDDVWTFLTIPFGKITGISTTKTVTIDGIVWEYNFPKFKSHKAIRKEHIKKVRPLCRKCSCELIVDTSYPIERTTYRIFKFTCPSCNLVHDITAETISEYRSELIRRIAHKVSAT